MKRYVTLEEISDGKLYQAKDMVRADCHGCDGCSACCQGMGSSIILDPYDVWRMTSGMQTTFLALLDTALELQVVDGVILPNLKMQGEKEQCSFLDGQGRCAIHAWRPGICRLFPLGRYYEDGAFRYFLQTGQCGKNRAKVKVEKWIDTPGIREYEEFVCDWHYFLKRQEEKVNALLSESRDELVRKINMTLLQTFYLEPYEGQEAFYPQYARRKEAFAAAEE